MRKLVFSLWFSLMPLFLGICLPFVPFPGDVRLVNLLWGVVYGAGFFAIDVFGAFHPTQPSSAVSFAFFVWPLVVSGALFVVGRRLYQANSSRLRLLSVSILLLSSLAVTTWGNSLQSSLPTFTKYYFVFY
jgi:hypothetical protein